MNRPEPDEVRRPDRVLEALAARHRFDRPHALLALLTGPYSDQRLTGVNVLWTQPPVSERARARAAERAAADLGLDCGPVRARPWRILLPVVIRPGPSWWSWDEAEVTLALRYCHQLGNVLQAGVFTVTPRGWYAPVDELWGTSPPSGVERGGSGLSLTEEPGPNVVLLPDDPGPTSCQITRTATS